MVFRTRCVDIIYLKQNYNYTLYIVSPLSMSITVGNRQQSEQNRQELPVSNKAKKQKNLCFLFPQELEFLYLYIYF